MMDNAFEISVERASKHYGSGLKAVAALTEVSLQVPKGEFLSVMGPSGSGKSTLLNLVGALDTPSGGTVTVAGHEIAGLSDDARSDLRMRYVGIVFQTFNLFPSFTVEENVAWPLEFSGVVWREARRRAEAALGNVGLGDGARKRLPAELSGGEQQRVAIARALVTQPRLLLADEPTGNLDSATGKTILDLLQGLNREQQLTVVMVTHSSLAARYGHRTVELRDGRIVREVAGTHDRPAVRVEAVTSLRAHGG